MTYIDEDGNEAASFDVKCNWNDTWTASTIPGSCECEHSYRRFVRPSFKNQKIFGKSDCIKVSPDLVSGRFCPTPPNPPAEHNMVLVEYDGKPIRIDQVSMSHENSNLSQCLEHKCDRVLDCSKHHKFIICLYTSHRSGCSDAKTA